jgi:hypothetical protein
LTGSFARWPRGAGRTTVLILLTLGVLTLHGRRCVAQQPEAQTESRATGAITGTVTDAATGRPISGAIVTLEDRRSGRRVSSRVQATTPKGRFAFLHLPAADTYLLTSARPGYLDGGHGRTDPRGPGTPIALKDGQWIDDVRVTMARPGSISGTVVDERGEAVVGVHVRLLAQVPIAGRTQWLAGAVASTDDRGTYRIPGLGPGSYVVSVPSVQATLPASATIRPPGAWAGTSLADLTAMSESARAEKLLVDAGAGRHAVVGRYAVPPPPAPDGRRTAYPIVFYPNAASPADAAPVDLRPSEDRSGIDIQLRPVRTARVSGTVVGPPEAIGNLLLRLIPAGLEELGQGSEAATTVTLADGQFTFLDVPGGSYVIDARHSLLELTYTSSEGASTALPAPIPFSTRSAASGGVTAAPHGVQYSSLSDWSSVNYWGQVRVEVSEAATDDVVLPLRRPASLSGRFVWAPGSTPSSGSPRPALEPADGRRTLGVLSGAAATDAGAATFTIGGMMDGEYFLRVRGARVESIAWDGRDHTDRPFDGRPGRDITGVVVTLTSASSSIGGTVTEGGVASPGSAVIAFPVEPEGWSNYGFNPPRLTAVLSASDGRYRVEGLPAGEYFLVAVPASQERSWLDPAFLAGHAARASRVRLDRAGATIENVALSLVK